MKQRLLLGSEPEAIGTVISHRDLARLQKHVIARSKRELSEMILPADLWPTDQRPIPPSAFLAPHDRPYLYRVDSVVGGWQVVAPLPAWQIFGPNGRTVAAFVVGWQRYIGHVIGLGIKQEHPLVQALDARGDPERPSLEGMRELWLAVNPKHTEPLGQTMMINAFLLVWREMLPAELRDAQQPLIDALGRG